MPARYLIRFDDICPTMNWAIWEQIEVELIRHDIKPLMAVVPDNQDSKLQINEPSKEFWSLVRHWQSIGWTIGLHGYQHRYVTNQSGIVGLNARSEFAGLSESEQESKLRRGLALFEQEGVKANVWIAPAHSFDEVTLRVLHRLKLRVVSDGFHQLPYRDKNEMTWVPQQLWQFRSKRSGVWTVCYHHNNWRGNDLAVFKRDLTTYATHISSLDKVIEKYSYRHKTLGDTVCWQWNYRSLRARAQLGMIRQRLFGYFK